MQDFSQVGGEGIEMAEMSDGDGLPSIAETVGRRPDSPVGGSPAQNKNLGPGVCSDLDFGDIGGDIGDLPCPGVGHQLMVVGVIRHVSCYGFLFQPPDPMLETGCAGD